MKTFTITTALILSLILISCNNQNLVGVNSSQSISNISIAFSMKNAADGITRIEGILSRQSYDSLFTEFVILNDSATASFNNVAVGVWHLQVNAYNDSNTLKYTGSADVEVYAGETTPVSLTLNPVSGSINISVTWGNYGTNLIQNPSFEFNGKPSLLGWTINDTIWVKTIQEAPSGEGLWSLLIGPAFGPSPGGIAKTFITGQSGDGFYTLLFYERNLQSYAWGEVSLSQQRNGKAIFNDVISANSSQWALTSKSYKLNLMSTDTLVVKLFNYSLAVKVKSNTKIDSVTSGILFDGISLIKN